MGDVQHCLPCATEYVAGVAACADCGGPLTPGPLADKPAKTSSLPLPTSSPTPDAKLADLPGLQADFAVRALTLEGIVCGLECQGIRKILLPDGPPEEPLAVTLPVSIYVPSDRLTEAQQILRSLEPEDVIGAQWEPGLDGDADENSPPPFVSPPPEPTQLRDPGPAEGSAPPNGESTTLRLILFLVVAALATIYFTR